MMKKIKKPWIIPLLFTIVIIVAGSLYIGSLLSKEEQLSDEAVRSQLESMYGGTVDSLTMRNGVYIAELTRSGALYSAEIDAINGNVLSMQQLSEIQVEQPKVLSEKAIREVVAKKYPEEIERISLKENSETPFYEVEVAKNQALVKLVIDAISGEITSEETQGTTGDNTLITREEAIEIALGQLRGEVEYVNFQQTDDGGFYLIEIEQDNDEGEDLEAVFQIHAVTGEILSVVWDD